MPWILASILIIGLAFLAYTMPEARKIVAGLFVVIVIGVGFLIWREQSLDNRAENAITIEEVELRDFSTTPKTGLLYAKGSVKNLSEDQAVDTVDIRVRAHDCPSEELTDACEIVGESVEHIKLHIPAGQVRGIEKIISLSNLPAVKTLVWSYDVVAVRADVN